MGLMLNLLCLLLRLLVLSRHLSALRDILSVTVHLLVRDDVRFILLLALPSKALSHNNLSRVCVTSRDE